MVDARLRSEWLGQMRFEDLTDAAWRVFTNSLMWSVGNGTDGEIPKRFMRYLHPDGVSSEVTAELVKAGLWSEQQDSYVMPDWAGAMGQSTAEQVEKYREDARTRQQRKRDRAKQRREMSDTEDEYPGRQMEGITENVTRDVTSNVGTGTGTGTGFGYTDLPEDVDVNTGEVGAWPVAEIPADPGYCEHGLTIGFRCGKCPREIAVERSAA